MIYISEEVLKIIGRIRNSADLAKGRKRKTCNVKVQDLHNLLREIDPPVGVYQIEGTAKIAEWPDGKV